MNNGGAYLAATLTAAELAAERRDRMQGKTAPRYSRDIPDLTGLRDISDCASRIRRAECPPVGTISL